MTSSTTVRSPGRLYGRDDELAAVHSLLDASWRGREGAIVLSAPPGLGRTALLRAAADAHRDRGPVLYATAARPDRSATGDGPDGSFAPPTAAAYPVMSPEALAARLREPRKRWAPDDGRPLLICADDTHVWDPASRTTLAAVAHGPGAGSRTAVLLTAADGAAPFAGLPTLRLGPLDAEAASALLDRLAPGAGTDVLDPVVRAELLREAAGNPRLLVGLTDRLTPDELAGRAPLPYPLPGGEAVLAAHAARLDGLPAPARALLLLAAAAQEHEPDGAGADALLLLRAGTRHGLSRSFLDRALSGLTGVGGLLQRAGSRVHFAHRLIAPAVLRHTPWPHRRAAHELLAALLTEAADRTPEDSASGRARAAGPGGRPSTRAGDDRVLPEPADRGAGEAAARASTEAAASRTRDGAAPVAPPDGPAAGFVPGGPPAGFSPDGPAPVAPPGVSAPVPLAALVQRACAAPGPDPVLAARIEAAAVAPRPHAERSAALVRAARLSAGPALRAARFAAAAEQARLAGDPSLARALLARTGSRAAGAASPSGGGSRGLASYVHGMLALRSGPAADAHEALLAAAELLGPDDPRTPDALLGAAEAAWAAGDALGYLGALDRLAPTSPEGSLEDYRAGMAAVLEGRTAEGHARLRRCLDPAGSPARNPAGDAGGPAELLRAGVAGLVLGDIGAACRAGARALAALRTRGPDALLPQALEHLAYAELRAGRHAGARAHALEGLHAARRAGQPNSSARLHAVLALAASVEGPAEACAAHADAALAGAAPNGLVQAATLATWARARADLASGRPGEAAARLAPLIGTGPGRGHFAVRTLAVPCWVEAAVLAGRPPEESGELHAAVDAFASWAARTADPGAPAQLARCRALLAPADEADARYAEALAHHGRADGDFERARTLLLYGQWLRRRRRTREARGPLRDALVAFQRCTARAWAERAAGELRAAGEPAGSPRDAGDEPLAALTPQQQRIARCVAEGATNREVGLRLSLSPRTVDHHLRNVFAALGIRSRTELARLLRP
ncbi:LuxR family transcriptional regulator [Streptomyces sp. V2I9]|uniref:helix-turn-helix transcriptional regulator n=1 Tax=Streptomyces sp. V2I9 TaxID=3042304 RepID=UPI002785BA7D|nr:LuxR family transcriptional regulator [Streptomyces sp. V2I9]MDQ0983936.1 DNA-binding CsgD family transcriptional regulator [Streptomyces sp. V2I9]